MDKVLAFLTGRASVLCELGVILGYF